MGRNIYLIFHKKRDMKVEHLTLGGNSVIRDTSVILPLTIDLLKDFQVYKTVRTIPFPRTDFKVKISSSEEGCIFDIMKNGRLGVTNICCFRSFQKSELINMLKNLIKHMPVNLKLSDVI